MFSPRLASGLSVIAFAAGLSLSPAQAQEGLMMKSLLGSLGVIDEERDPIDYKARAPLVVPPASKLPQPKDAVAARAPNWPKDADLARREAARADMLMPATQREKYNSHKLLSPEEIQHGRIAARPVTEPMPAASNNLMGMSPHELMLQPIRDGREAAARRTAEEDALIRSGVEPPRRYLTDPPSGLRRASQTVKADRSTPTPVESRFGQLEFQQDQNRR